MTKSLQLIATAAFGLEAIVARELSGLGYESTTLQPGRLLVDADEAAVAQLNIRLRVAERVLIRVGTFVASDFDALFEQTRQLPWERWIPRDGSFPVRGRSIKSQLTSVPAVQRCVKKAVAERLAAAHGVRELPETAADYGIEVAILRNQATLTLDTTGPGLHKRGYRTSVGPGPLRETLAAAMVLLSCWSRHRPLADPFCGSGTIPIEAAMIGRQIAPGAQRSFAAESWPTLPVQIWSEVRDEVRQLATDRLPERIVGTDFSRRSLPLARQHAAAAGVEQDIHFESRPFDQLRSNRRFGCVICHPPHDRLSSADAEQLYRSIPIVLRRLPTWSHFILTAYPSLEAVIGQTASRRRKLYNGRTECQFYQFMGPKPPHLVRSPSAIRETADESAPATESLESTPRIRPRPQPVFGGLDQQASRQALEFKNRLVKRMRHLRRWPARGITCYRLYERDIPEIPLVVDRYENWLHIAEFDRPHDRTPAQQADWLDLMVAAAAEATQTLPSQVAVKRRCQQRGAAQYTRLAEVGRRLIVNEAGLRFYVDLESYLDTGLFLDHRQTRDMVRTLSDGKRVLNLFCYTGSFTTYAADGNATSTTSVDWSQRYLDWTQDNLKLNDLDGKKHRLVKADAMTFLRDLHPDVRYDLAVVDPPTFSNSKALNHDWNIQRDHIELLERVTQHMTPNGLVLFSSNFRRLRFQGDKLSYQFREISSQTVPEDFRNRRIHRCWKGFIRQPEPASVADR